METIIISNSCVGYQVISQKKILPYNNPFIATLIPNDLDYIKLINNLDHYRSCIPRLGDANPNSMFAQQNGSLYYIHSAIKTPYPIIYLDDIEIHCLHDKNYIQCLEKFKKRLNRMNEIIDKGKYKIFALLSFSELFNDHQNYEIIIDSFLESKHSIIKYFLGPSQYNNKNPNYIYIDIWDKIELKRNSSHVFEFNDQQLLKRIFLRLIP